MTLFEWILSIAGGVVLIAAIIGAGIYTMRNKRRANAYVDQSGASRNIIEPLIGNNPKITCQNMFGLLNKLRDNNTLHSTNETFPTDENIFDDNSTKTCQINVADCSTILDLLGDIWSNMTREGKLTPKGNHLIFFKNLVEFLEKIYNPANNSAIEVNNVICYNEINKRFNKDTLR